MKPFHLAFAAGLGAVVAGSLAWAAPTTTSPIKDQDRAVTVLARADFDAGSRGPEADGLAHGPKPFGPRGRQGGDFGGPRFGPLLAARLAEQETAIGIRAKQLDAWRDYSDALQAMLAPPNAPTAKAAGEAFGVERAMADEIAVRGEAATRLKGAINALKTKLSPEQLARAARVLGPGDAGGPKAPPPPFEPSPGSDSMERGPAQPG